MRFPEQLKKARQALGYTQRQVANAMGITNSTYCGYETGKRRPDVTKIKQLADILHTSGDVVLETCHLCKDQKRDNPRLYEAMLIFQSLRPEFQDYALEQIKHLAELQNKSQV